MYTNTIRSITIGSFDGIHLAHQALIAQAEAVVAIERGGGYLTPGYKRADYLKKPLFLYLFEHIRMLSAEAFVAKLRTDFPRLEKIVVGYDFRFGRNKEGDTATLQRYFDKEVVVVPEIVHEGMSVHSRTIGALIEKGDIATANRLLGRTYRVEGRLVAGQGLGKKALVPTINLRTEGYRLPKEGVYATRTSIDGHVYDSVTFTGHRVTTDGSFALETHILDETCEVAPHTKVAIAWYRFVRENRKFDTLEALKKRIEADIAETKEILSCVGS